MEINYAVEPIGVKYICDSCGSGEMIPTCKNDWAAHPPQFEHECNVCNFQEMFNEKYPLIRYH